MRMLKMICSAVLVLSVGCSAAPSAGETKAIFENNFEQEKHEAVPEGFLVGPPVKPVFRKWN